jgi:hypothetical protein
LETWMSFNFGCNKRHGDILMGISWGYFDGWYGMTFSQLKNLRMPYQYHPIKKKNTIKIDQNGKPSTIIKLWPVRNKARIHVVAGSESFDLDRFHHLQLGSAGRARYP